jgi:hypothetical protein
MLPKLDAKDSHQGLKNAELLQEMECQEEIKRAELFYQYQQDTASQLYQTELEAYLQEYNQEHDTLQEQMLEQLEARKRKLKDDYDNLDLQSSGNLLVNA